VTRLISPLSRCDRKSSSTLVSPAFEAFSPSAPIIQTSSRFTLHSKSQWTETHPPFNICARPVFTPKVPLDPPEPPAAAPRLMTTGVDVPFAPVVVGRALEEGTTVGSDMLAWASSREVSS